MRLIPHSRPDIDDADIAAVTNALRSLHLSQGKEVEKLENTLSEMFDGAEAVVCSSGTAALYLALKSFGVKEGDNVVVPSYTCNSLYSSVAFAGAEAVCADVAEGGINPGPSTISPLITENTSCIIAPHTCGYTADIDGIKALGIPVIEDCAQAIGGKYDDGSLLGSRGDAAVLSFYATKLLPSGEGGACITADPERAELMRRLRDCDEREPDPRAFNFKMPDITAALATEKLMRLQFTTSERASIASVYDEAFGLISFRTTSAQKQAQCFRYLLNITGNVDEFLLKSEKLGVVCRRPIWRSLHHTIGGNCPCTEDLESRLVSVPIYPGMEEQEIKRVCGITA